MERKQKGELKRLFVGFLLLQPLVSNSEVRAAAGTCNILVEASVCIISEQAGRRKDPNPRWLPATPAPPVTLGNDSEGQDCQLAGVSRQWGCRMSPGRQKSTHLTPQLWGFPVAAEDGGSLALQHALQGSTLCPTHSHQQHFLPTCATQGKAFRHPRAGHKHQQLHGAPLRPPMAAALQQGLQRGSEQNSAVCLHNHSSCASRAALREPVQ